MAFVWATFWQHCQNSNQSISRRSSLSKLTKRLKDPSSTAGQIIEEMVSIPDVKQRKYQNALNYLRQNFPGNVPAIAVPGNGQAVPIKFRTNVKEYKQRTQYIQVYDSHGGNLEMVDNATKHHCIVTCKWQSSSGNLGHLANVASRELCTYRTRPDQPPFNSTYSAFVQQYPNLQYAQPDNSLSNTMKFGSNDDDHSVNDPNYTCCNPRQVGRLIMDQVYQYNVTNNPHNANWIDIPNARFLIIKEVVRKRGRWYFRWTKKHAVGNKEKMLYSYDVRLGPVPAKLPQGTTDFTL